MEKKSLWCKDKKFNFGDNSLSFTVTIKDKCGGYPTIGLSVFYKNPFG